MLRSGLTFVQKAAGNLKLSTLTRPLYVTPKQHFSTETAQNSDDPIDIPNPFEKEKQKCILCQHDITPNYKNVKLLSQFQSPYTGRIYGRHITGLCNAKQEQVEKAIIHAQNCAMMPYYHKDLDFLKDPKLFDPERPVRPHKY
ncbi:28S ribosomal protein S18c, mitochondrial isoform X1 [Eupeodes corollae]|uniref:28S ribosomal protein S18c, mitochondrial isoform X1 n=1 Tax=Eupeodes corollae TaxID=290404 RepID=UPI0024934B5E|nr:28S ribosomal protein S18c, mitochondrial isoform X1 [Eupeodes corollae]